MAITRTTFNDWQEVVWLAWTESLNVQLSEKLNGPRINEALALTRGDFSLAPPYPFVQLATLKQRTEKAARTAGRAPAGPAVRCELCQPAGDDGGHSEDPAGAPQQANRQDRTVRTWLGEAVESAVADGVTFSVPVTPHTFRHSYAMHMLYAGIPLKVLQSHRSARQKCIRRCLRSMWPPVIGYSFRCQVPKLWQC